MFKGLLNIIIFGAVIGYLMTASHTEIDSTVSTIGDIFVNIVTFIANGLLKLVELMK